MLSAESLPYIIDAMGSTSAGQELISAFSTPTVLSADTYTRLQDALSDDSVAQNVQAALMGTQQLQLRDVQFLKAALSAPLSVLQSVTANIAGGINPVININYI